MHCVLTIFFLFRYHIWDILTAVLLEWCETCTRIADNIKPGMAHESSTSCSALALWHIDTDSWLYLSRWLGPWILKNLHIWSCWRVGIPHNVINVISHFQLLPPAFFGSNSCKWCKWCQLFNNIAYALPAAMLLYKSYYCDFYRLFW